MTIIDLGEITATDFEPPRPPARGVRQLIRPIALAVVALLTVVTATASARTAAPKGLRPLWDVPMSSADAVYLARDTVFVTRMNTDQDRAALTAYDAATGAVRWTADAGPVISYPGLVTSTGTVLQPVAMHEVRRGDTTISNTQTTVALDGATGARLWQLDADAVHAVGDTVLMAEYGATGQVNRLRLVRLSDGGTIWSRALVANSAAAMSDDVVVTIDDHGTVTVLRWADGSVLRTRTVPWTPDQQVQGFHSDVGIVGNALIVSRWDEKGAAVSAVYRLDTLAGPWRSAGYVGDCGVVLCSLETDHVVGRDPLTGTERWRRPGVSNALPIGSDRLLVQAPQDTVGQQLVDDRTGRTVATLGAGQPPWTWGKAGGPLLLVRPVGTAPMHVTVLRIDPATGAEFTLGALAWMGDDSSGCQAGSRYLVCPGNGRLSVTAVG